MTNTKQPPATPTIGISMRIKQALYARWQKLIMRDPTLSQTVIFEKGIESAETSKK
jgi:hypothetical protein